MRIDKLVLGLCVLIIVVLLANAHFTRRVSRSIEKLHLQPTTTIQPNEQRNTFDIPLVFENPKKVLWAFFRFETKAEDHMVVTCLDESMKVKDTIFNYNYSKHQYRDYRDFYLFELSQKCIRLGKLNVRITLRSPTRYNLEKIQLQTITEDQNVTVVNESDVEGYTDKLSYAPGETIELKTHCNAKTFEVSVDRMGSKNTDVHVSKPISCRKQNYPKYASLIGAGWKTSYRIKVSPNWKTGLYHVRLKTDEDKKFMFPIVIRPTKRQSTIAVLANTNTWTAYNPWGKASFYMYKIHDETDQEITNTISFDRPNSNSLKSRHLYRIERHLPRWLEDNKLSYDMISDSDLHYLRDPLRGYKILALHGHPEYWSTVMYDRIQAFLNRGGHLLYLGGNGAFYRSEFKGNQLISRKDSSIHFEDGSQGGLWTEMGRHAASLLGVEFIKDSAHTEAPYKVVKADHWIMEGTNLKKGDLFAENKSGFEMDVITENSPANLVHLAKGQNKKGGGGDIVYFEHPGGGSVFSVGSIVFNEGIPEDKHVERIIRNVFNYMLKN